MIGTSVSSAMLEKSMSALWQKSQLVLDNIANEDTPNYRARRMDFESVLKKELQQGRTTVSAFGGRDTISRIRDLEPTVYEDTTTAVRADGNNVDIDSEYVELARIQLQWDAMVAKVSGHYSTLKYAITGGR